jgi:TRAP-type mannitol/chloroaromatic compound transport system permease small subunit
MNLLLRLAASIDGLNRRVGHSVSWLVLVMVLVSAVNALTRYGFQLSSNAWLELQWYLFGAVFLLAAGFTLQQDAHIRIDVLSSRYSPRAKAWLDILGTLLFLLPLSVFMVALSWPMFVHAWMGNEVSSSAGGLARWPVRLMVPAGFLLLSLQGLSQMIKAVALLLGRPLELPIATDRNSSSTDSAVNSSAGGAGHL